ncbi:MAG: 50S ribosomal protein L29 [Anaerolineales bacterium]|jgi:large subunit ribosomal protein L29
MMAIEELRNMTSEEIQSKLEESREELMNLRFQQSTGELTDHNQIRFIRRQIARLLTVQREREIDLEMESES